MRWSSPGALALLLIVVAGLGVSAGPTTTDDDDAGRAVIRKALDRAIWNEEQNFAAKLSSVMTREVRHFDGDGAVEKQDQSDYEVFPIGGAPYERRLTVNGRSLSEEELVWEREREDAFRDELQEHGHTHPEDEDDDVVFNEQLISRYAFNLEGEELLRYRPSYRVSFRPRPGDLPVRKRIDYALNAARGTVWIDRATHEAARVEFELIDKVRLWWGVLGTINRARGSLDRGPVLGDTWGRIQLESYTDVRVVFSRTRRGEFRTWRDFEWVD